MGKGCDLRLVYTSGVCRLFVHEVCGLWYIPSRQNVCTKMLQVSVTLFCLREKVLCLHGSQVLCNLSLCSVLDVKEREEESVDVPLVIIC